MGNSKCAHYVYINFDVEENSLIESECTIKYNQWTQTFVQGSHMNNSCLPRDQYYKMLITLDMSVIYTLSGHLFVCGNHAYNQLPPGWYGFCYVAFLVPSSHILHTLPKVCMLNRRDQYTF